MTLFRFVWSKTYLINFVQTSTGFRWCSKPGDCSALMEEEGGDGNDGGCFRCRSFSSISSIPSVKRLKLNNFLAQAPRYCQHQLWYLPPKKVNLHVWYLPWGFYLNTVRRCEHVIKLLTVAGLFMSLEAHLGGGRWMLLRSCTSDGKVKFGCWEGNWSGKWGLEKKSL